MRRRDFLEAITAAAAVIPALALVSWTDQLAFAQGMHRRAQTSEKLRALNERQDALVTCIAELILPQTDTVGATGVGVNRFIDLLMSEAVLEKERDRFLTGLAAIEARSQSLHGASFASLSKDQQGALMLALDIHQPLPKPSETLANLPMSAERGFVMLKRLVVFAYFTSEPVAKDLIAAPIIPGRYDGCIPV